MPGTDHFALLVLGWFFYFSFPFTVISVALWVNKTAEIGLIYNPILDELYTARRGMGAFCNGKQIYCSKVKGAILSDHIYVTQMPRINYINSNSTDKNI